jgi:predicted LPLAT superfamily acyltransferase
VSRPETPGPARPWTSRSVGSRLQHRIFWLLIRIGGRRAAYALLHPVTWWYVYCRPSLRRRGDPYLSRRFPRPGGGVRLGDTRRHILALGKVLVDRAVMGILGPGGTRVTLRGKEEILGLLGEGRGLVIMSAHVGCWQVGMAALAFLEEPVSMVMQKEEGDVDRHYFEHAGLPSPYRIIDPRGWLGGSVEMIEVLTRKEVLGIMGDRVLGGAAGIVAADFLGGKVPLPVGPYRLASASGAPIAVIFSYKTGPDSYELALAGVIRVPPGLGRKPEAYAPHAARFAELLEAYTREHPYQFFNFFDMWGQGTEESA